MLPVFITSIQHTGTWFIIRLLIDHSRVSFFCGFRTWILNERKENNPYYPGPTLETPDDVVLFHQHITTPELLQTLDDLVDQKPIGLFTHMLIGNVPTIIPLRDPLRVLISRETRKPGTTSTIVAPSFEYLAGLKNVRFLPVDLLRDYNFAKRKNALMKCLDGFALPYEPYMDEICKEWKPIGHHSPKPESKLREWYKNREIEKLAKVFGKSFTMLKEREHIIKPFLQSHGYTDFVW